MTTEFKFTFEKESNFKQFCQKFQAIVDVDSVWESGSTEYIFFLGKFLGIDTPISYDLGDDFDGCDIPVFRDIDYEELWSFALGHENKATLLVAINNIKKMARGERRKILIQKNALLEHKDIIAMRMMMYLDTHHPTHFFTQDTIQKLLSWLLPKLIGEQLKELKCSSYKSLDEKQEFLDTLNAVYTEKLESVLDFFQYFQHTDVLYINELPIDIESLGNDLAELKAISKELAVELKRCSKSSNSDDVTEQIEFCDSQLNLVIESITKVAILLIEHSRLLIKQSSLSIEHRSLLNDANEAGQKMLRSMLWFKHPLVFTAYAYLLIKLHFEPCWVGLFSSDSERGQKVKTSYEKAQKALDLLPSGYFKGVEHALYKMLFHHVTQPYISLNIHKLSQEEANKLAAQFKDKYTQLERTLNSEYNTASSDIRDLDSLCSKLVFLMEAKNV